MTVAVISHPNCSAHDMGEYHPESPARMEAITKQLCRHEAELDIQQLQASPIDPKLLSLAHDQDYIDFIFANAPTTGIFEIDADTQMNPFTLNAALLAAGSVIDAVDSVMSDDFATAFCAIRPPGHHAERDKSMGFCLFNNVAIAALYAKQKYKLERIAIVDFDVHHGNGTENIISDKIGFLFCSLFQHPFYPFSGAGLTADHIINSPLPSSAGSIEIRQVVTDVWLPALNNFKPEMLFISAGFDAHVEDSISKISLQESDYYWITSQLKTVADRFADGCIVSVLEGGYALDALGRSVIAHLKALIGN